MCVIITHESGASLPTYEQIKNSLVANQDGAGIAWADGVLHIVKWVEPDAKTVFNKIMELGVNTPWVYHARFATHGEVSHANTHPYQLSPEIAFAHNGVLHGYGNHKMSDSRHFARKFKLGKVRLDELHSVGFVDDLDPHIQSGKFAFISADGRITIVGRRRGVELSAGLWASNSYSLAPSYSSYSRTDTNWCKALSMSRNTYGSSTGLWDDDSDGVTDWDNLDSEYDDYDSESSRESRAVCQIYGYLRFWNPDGNQVGEDDSYEFGQVWREGAAMMIYGIPADVHDALWDWSIAYTLGDVTVSCDSFMECWRNDPKLAGKRLEGTGRADHEDIERRFDVIAGTYAGYGRLKVISPQCPITYSDWRGMKPDDRQSLIVVSAQLRDDKVAKSRDESAVPGSVV